MNALDIRPDGPPCAICGISLVSNRSWQRLPRDIRGQLLEQRALSGRRAKGCCHTCNMRQIRAGEYVPHVRKKYEPCLDCNVTMVSHSAWLKIDPAERERHLAIGDLNAYGGLGKCQRCCNGARERSKAYRWPEKAVALTGGQWVVRRGIRVWEPTKVRAGAASR